MHLSHLPKEILLLVIANLRIRDVKSLALTLNRSITDVCLPLLEALSAKIRNDKYVASLFSRVSQRDFVDTDSLRHRGGLGDLWHHWMDAWDSLEADQELPRLASLGIPGGDIQELTTPRSPSISTTILERETLVNFELAKSLDVEIPASFRKAISDQHVVDQITAPGGCFAEVGKFQLMPARMTRGTRGYMFPFLHHSNLDWSWYLYFEPGKEHRHCVLRIDNVGRTTNVDDELMWGVLSNMITDEDRWIAEQRGVRLELMDPDNIHLAGFSFPEWLAHRLFNAWMPPSTAEESAEIASRAKRGSGPEAPLHSQVPQQKGRVMWFRRVFRR